MGRPGLGMPEEEVKRWLSQIALICLSEEFQELRKELESIYRQHDVENVKLVAFQDALYAFLAEEEDGWFDKPGAS